MYKMVETKTGRTVFYHLELDGEAVTKRHRTRFAAYREYQKNNIGDSNNA